jgi:hypothetical protein
MSEKLISRAAQMLSFGVTEDEVISKFVAEGYSKAEAFLAVKAGKLFASTMS